MSFFKKLGVGLGRLDVCLYHTTFGYGDCIAGEISLEMDEDIEARGLSVWLYATQEERRPEYNPDSRRYDDSRHVHHTLFREDLLLGGSDHYASGRYPFELLVPQGINQGYNAPPAGGFFQSLVRPRDNYSRVRWYVKARLEIPWSVDLSNYAEIQVSQHQSYRKQTRRPSMPPQAVENQPQRHSSSLPKFCRSCGNQFADDARFCEGCGGRRGA